MLPRIRQGIVSSDTAEQTEEGVTFLNCAASELAERVLGGRSRHKLSTADRQRCKSEQPLVIFGEPRHELGQELERAGVRRETVRCCMRGSCVAEHFCAGEEVCDKWFANGYCHGPGDRLSYLAQHNHNSVGLTRTEFLLL
jgi:hypothetical protein